MDFLSSWGMRSPIILYVLAALIMLVGFYKRRNKNFLWWGLNFVIIGFLFSSSSTLTNDNPNSVSWWLNVILILGYPLAGITIIYTNRRRYARAEQPMPSAWGFRAAIALLAVMTIVAGVAFYFGHELRKCGRLDVALDRSGCAGELAVGLQTIEAVAFSPDGTVVATGGSDNIIQFFRVSDQALLRTLSGHANWVTGLSFSPDGKFLASGSWDGTVRIWDLESNTPVYTMTVPTERGFETIYVAISPDGKLVAAASYKSGVYIWRMSDGAFVRTIPVKRYIFAFSPDGQQLAGEGADFSVAIWRVQDGQILAALQGHTYPITGLSYSPDGNILASSSGGDNAIRLWRTQDNNLLGVLPSTTSTNLAFSADGRLLASGGFETAGPKNRYLVEVWNVADQRQLVTWVDHDMVNSIDISPDGHTVSSGTGFQTVRLWRVPSSPKQVEP